MNPTPLADGFGSYKGLDTLGAVSGCVSDVGAVSDRDWNSTPIADGFGSRVDRQSPRISPPPSSPESRAPSPGRQSGFTLIEVMAAFAIFAVLFGVMLQILSTSITNTRRSGDFTQAALLAQSQLDMVGIEALPEPGTYSGRYNDDYSWELIIEPYRIQDDRGVSYEDLPIDLYYVGLTVYWGEGRSERSALFETLRSVDRFYAEREARRG